MGLFLAPIGVTVNINIRADQEDFKKNLDKT